MRILVAGATGVVGRRLLPLLLRAGHEVWGTTRRPERAAQLIDMGAHPVVADAYDPTALAEAFTIAAPDVVVHQLTDLAGEDRAANARLRIEGTRNLVDAALAAGVETMVAQSIAWIYAPGATPAVEDDPLDPEASPFPGVSALEEAVAAMPRGVVLRYGMLYGPGTWYARDGAMADRARAGELRATPTWSAFLHADDAAAAALAALDGLPAPSTSSTTSPRPSAIGCRCSARRSAPRRRRPATVHRAARCPTPRRASWGGGRASRAGARASGWARTTGSRGTSRDHGRLRSGFRPPRLTRSIGEALARRELES
jgi:nucleoside-diphosphate-sugar epimerase